MKVLVVVFAFLAVASAGPEVREKRGILGSTLLAGPSGTIISSPGLIAPGLIGARSLVAPGLLAPGVVLASPGVTAGTVFAPGTTLVGPSNYGTPGAVITNGLLGTQILA